MNSFLELVDAYRSDPSAVINFQFIVWMFVLGIIVSFFFIYYKRRVIGSFIRALRNAEAYDPENAKTLIELEQEDNVNAIAALHKSGALQKIITIRSEGEDVTPSKNVTIDENTRFYIKKEAVTRSRVQYGDENEPVWPLILGSLALIGVGVITLFIGK